MVESILFVKIQESDNFTEVLAFYPKRSSDLNEFQWSKRNQLVSFSIFKIN